MNKAISIIKCMKMLDNSSRGLAPIQKRYLYICCVLSIALYSFQLWCYELMLKGLSKETTLVLSNTKELNRVPNTK